MAEATDIGADPSEAYSVRFQVRDYECDLQGIVNNAVYLHYLEHARHEFLKSKGASFAELTARGVILVVIRAELEYHRPLRPGDVFEVRLRCQRSRGMRHLFLQDIILDDGTRVLTARIEWTTIDPAGKPRRLDKGLEALFS